MLKFDIDPPYWRTDKYKEEIRIAKEKALIKKESEHRLNKFRTKMHSGWTYNGTSYNPDGTVKIDAREEINSSGFYGTGYDNDGKDCPDGYL